MKQIQSFVLGAVILLSGCAAPPQLADLKTPQVKAAPVSLPSNLCTNIDGAFGKEAEVCVLSGTYRLDKENALGYFFLGDLPSVYWKLGSNFVLVKGGIWLPRDAATKPRIYFYQTAGTIRGKSVDEIEKARGTPLPPRDPSESTQVATSIAMQSTPASATPMQSGLGAGIAAGIVGAFADAEPQPSLYGEPKSPAFTETVRNLFRVN